MTRFMEEFQSCVGNLNDMDSFNELFQELALIDIQFGGGPSHGSISE